MTAAAELRATSGVAPTPALAGVVAVAAALGALSAVGVLPVACSVAISALGLAGALALSGRAFGTALAWAWAACCVAVVGGCLVVVIAGEGWRRGQGDLLLAAGVVAAMALADVPRWGHARRARSGLAFSLALLAVAFSVTGETSERLVGPFVVWAAGAAVVLVAARRAPTPLTVQGSSRAGPEAAARGRRDGMAVAGAALVVVLVALPWLAQQGLGRISPDRFERLAGRAVGPGGDALRYDDELDTGDRGVPGDEVVLRVRADAPDFWRAQTFDVWDGRAWSTSGAPSPEPPTPDGAPFVQEVRVEAWTDLVVAAYRPARVRLPDGVAARPAPGEGVRAVPGLAAGDRYVVESHRPEVTVELLRQHDPLAAVPSRALRPFLELPDDVPPRVTALARDVAGDAPTAYDAVVALERWLGDNTTYTLDIPPLPAGADGVEQFLFVDRRGFCNQIAASLTVMARSLGIPARVATGYVPGERDRVTGEWVVRSSDAHAWVEVWFPGLGWQGFDPTAEVPLSGEEAPGPLAWWRLVLGAAAAAGAALGAVVLLRRRRASATRPWPQQLVARLEAEGARRARARAPHETLAEYADALVAGPLPDGRLREVAAALAAAAFSGQPAPPGARARAEALLDAVLVDHPVPSARPRVRAAAGSPAGGGQGDG